MGLNDAEKRLQEEQSKAFEKRMRDAPWPDDKPKDHPMVVQTAKEQSDAHAARVAAGAYDWAVEFDERRQKGSRSKYR